jgi:outer membrane protein W
MKKYIILTFTLLSCIGLAIAQDGASENDSGSDGEEIANQRKAGEFTGALMFGRGNFLESGQGLPSAPGYNTANGWRVDGNAPFANTVDANDNNIGNMVGGEARYFVTDRIAVKLSGGAVLRNTPALQNVEYTLNDATSPNSTWIPQYGSVVADNTVETNVNLGAEYHFSSKAKRIFPYLGANFNHYYSRRSMYDPTIDYDDGDPSSSTLIYDVGVRTVEVVGLGMQAVAGLDYYVSEGVYVGVDIKPVTFLYAYNSKRPAPGLPLLQAETSTWSFFAQPMFKIGFYIGSL